MGLDMYLYGDAYFYGERSRTERKGEYYQLGYWRKHPNLHGFIVETFAHGQDCCQRIDLSADDIRTILKAVRAKTLPHTDGFLFGKSDGSEVATDIEIFTDALAWLETDTPSSEWRSIYYQASW